MMALTTKPRTKLNAGFPPSTESSSTREARFHDFISFLSSPAPSVSLPGAGEAIAPQGKATTVCALSLNQLLLRSLCPQHEGAHPELGQHSPGYVPQFPFTDLLQHLKLFSNFHQDGPINFTRKEDPPPINGVTASTS